MAERLECQIVLLCKFTVLFLIFFVPYPQPKAAPEDVVVVVEVLHDEKTVVLGKICWVTISIFLKDINKPIRKNANK